MLRSLMAPLLVRMCSLPGRVRLYLALAAVTVQASDWPRFRGPNGTGVSDGARLPAEIRAGSAEWSVPMPPGHSSPIVFGRRIFLTAVESNRLWTIAVDLSGRELWRRECPRSRLEPLDRRNSPASPTPAANSSGVYVFFPDFGLIAYTLEGREKWRTPLGPFRNYYGMGASPVLAGNSVVLVCDQTRDSFIAAFDRSTGRERWRTARPEAVSGHSTPALWRGQIVAPGSFRMDSYSSATGESLWHVRGLASEMKSVPVVNGDAVYINGYNLPENEPGRQVRVLPFEDLLARHDTNGDARLQREESPDERVRGGFAFLDLNGDAALDAEEWKMYANALAAENGLLAFRPNGRRGDITVAGLLWKYQRSVPQLPSTLLYRGVLYMINDGGILTTLDPAAGTVHKQARVRGVSGQYYSSPVAGDGKVYFLNRACELTVLAGAAQNEIARGELDGECYATPAIAEGRLFIRTSTALHAFRR